MRIIAVGVWIYVGSGTADTDEFADLGNLELSSDSIGYVEIHDHTDADDHADRCRGRARLRRRQSAGVCELRARQAPRGEGEQCSSRSSTAAEVHRLRDLGEDLHQSATRIHPRNAMLQPHRCEDRGVCGDDLFVDAFHANNTEINIIGDGSVDGHGRL